MKLMHRKIACGILIGSSFVTLSCKNENIEPAIDTSQDSRAYVSLMNFEENTSLIIRYHINSSNQIYKSDTVFDLGNFKVSFALPDKNEKYLYIKNSINSKFYKTNINSGGLKYITDNLAYGYPYTSDEGILYFQKTGENKLQCLDTKSDIQVITATGFSNSESFSARKNNNYIFYSNNSTIHKGQYNNPNVNEVLYSNGENIGRIVVDPATEKIYWMDHLKTKIIKKSIADNQVEETIISTGGDDFDIDFSKDMVFYSGQWNESLHVSSTNGIKNEEINIDYPNGWSVTDIQIVSPKQ